MAEPGTGLSDAGSVDPYATPGDSGADASGTHYPTHESAETAAKKWQGDFDRLEASTRDAMAYHNAFAGVGTAEQIQGFIREAQRVQQMPGYADFAAGRTPNGADTSSYPDTGYGYDDTEIDTRQADQDLKLEGIRIDSAAREAALRFDLAEAKLDDLFGDIWHPYKSKISSRVELLARSGGLKDPSKITPELLSSMVLSEIGSAEGSAMRQSVVSLANRWENQRVNVERGASTTAAPRPGGGPGAEAGRTPAKTIRQAWELGQADRLNASRRATG